MMTQVVLDLAVPTERIVEAVVQRVGGLRLVGQASLANAVVTDRIDRAEQHAREGRWVLQLAPLQMCQSQTFDAEFYERIVPGWLSRCTPRARQAKRELQAAHLGSPGLLRIHDWNPSHPLDDPRIAEQLDVVCWLIGEPPCTLYAVSQKDSLQIHLGFKSDAMALVVLDCSCAMHRPFHSLHLIGSEGAVYADDHHDVQLLLEPGGWSAETTDPSQVAWSDLLSSFAESISDQDCQRHAWANVMRINRIVAAVRDSLSRHEAVSLEGGGE